MKILTSFTILVAILSIVAALVTARRVFDSEAITNAREHSRVQHQKLHSKHQHSNKPETVKSSFSKYDPKLHNGARFKDNGDMYRDFLLNNHLPSGMPRSFAIYPSNYFETVPASERPQHYNTSHYIVPCNNMSVPASAMNAYMFQTEQLLTALGLNIYDAAIWCIALSTLGNYSTCLDYYNNVLIPDQTVQFKDIRGDKPCAGVTEYGQCVDTYQDGACGLCYGDGNSNAAMTLTQQNAYFFRLISDYWSIEGTVDQRCPSLNEQWTWNDYKPILGENAWAQLLGPANMAMIHYNNDPTQVPASDPLFKLGIPFLSALEKMKVGNTGAFYYTPKNTFFGFSKVAGEIGNTFSIENQGSLLAGLEALNYIITQNPSSPYASYTAQIQGYISGIKKFLLSAYDTENQYFRQGGTYDATTGQITWGQNNEPLFAVDCQTWVSSVLGTKLIDSTFGPRTAFKLWQTVKARANWTCPGGGLCGIGYTDNDISGQVFSGEWSIGAQNWLQIMVADSGYDSHDIASIQSDYEAIWFGLESYLYDSTPINNSTESYNSLYYAERRYYIPFGWYANPLPATSSTAWAAVLASGYNPFNVDGGKYTKSY